MADKNAELVWNKEKGIAEFVYTDATPEEIAEAKRQRDEREIEIAAVKAVETVKQTDFAELRGQKAQSAIDKLADDLAKIDGATPLERLAMQKRTMTYLLAVMKILKHQLG